MGIQFGLSLGILWLLSMAVERRYKAFTFLVSGPACSTGRTDGADSVHEGENKQGKSVCG